MCVFTSVFKSQHSFSSRRGWRVHQMSPADEDESVAL